ncbi:MAG: hypothetical protein PVF85_01685 [Anaerolineales bacterium]|jgi:hypothetical protein
MQIRGVCPECDGEVCFPFSPVIDQRIRCAFCGSDLVVIRTNPIVLDWAFVEPLSRMDRDESLDPLPYSAWADR